MKDLKQLKKQYDTETFVRWGISSFFWFITCALVTLLGWRLWVMFTSYYGALLATNKYWMSFAERAFVYIIMLIVAVFYVFLFFKFVDPMRKDDESFLVEDNPYFKKHWVERVELLQILKLFLIVSCIGLGVWMVTWLSMLLLAALA